MRNGRRINGPYFALIHLASGHDRARLGIAISRRVSPKATERNRIKRTVRECFRHQADGLAPEDIVVLLRSAAGTASSAEIASALAAALKRLEKQPAPPSSQSLNLS
jgi:ribonuclease P protein component